MPACPHCGDVVTEAEWATGRCPMCGERAGWTRGPHSSDYLPRPKPVYAPEHDRPNWGTTRAGLGLMIVGICLLWAFATGMVIASQNAERHLGDQQTWSSAGSYTLWVVSAIGLFGSPFIVLAGMTACVRVPGAFGSRAWVIASLGAAVLMLLFAIDVIYMSADNALAKYRGFTESYDEFGHRRRMKIDELPHHQDTIGIRDKAWKVFGILSHLLFLTFVWSLARSLQRRGLARSCLALLAAMLAFHIAWFVSLWSEFYGGVLQQLKGSVEQFANIDELLLSAAVVLSAWFVTNLVVIRRLLTKLIRGDSIEPFV